jgi:hypothetical protein
MVAGCTREPTAESGRETEGGTSTSTGESGLITPSLDPNALDEIVAKAGALPPPSAVSTKRGTPSGAPKPPAIEDAGPSVVLGSTEIQPRAASAAIERALRRQVYHRLVTRCRDDHGAILSPDAIRLEFTIDAEGRIVPSTITAAPAVSGFDAAALCMRRELSASSFRLPPSARGATAHVSATVPSVD